MGAFKQLLSSDVIISPLEVNKGFNYSSSKFIEDDVQIDRFIGIKGDYLLSSSLTTGDISTESQVLVYDSIKELYYSNYLSSSLLSVSNTSSIIPGSDPSGDVIDGPTYTTNYYNYLSTDLTIPRFIPTDVGDIIGVLSIPSRLFGDHLTPGSIRIQSGGFSIIDDGEGTLYLEGITPSFNYGNVIYEHGIIIFTNSGSYNNGDGPGPTLLEGYGYEVYSRSTSVYGGGLSPDTIPEISNMLTGSINLEFSSSYEILETQYKVTLKENEFNLSLNPSLISSSDGIVYDYVTGSNFSPYVTTVGLYTNDQELVAIGKLSQPLPTSRTTDTNIFINIDR
jgi:hypothetical protein